MLRKIGDILSYILIAFEAIFIVITLISKITNDVPSFFGYNFYVVATPSMTPEIQVGDVILSKEFKEDEKILKKIRKWIIMELHIIILVSCLISKRITKKQS